MQKQLLVPFKAHLEYSFKGDINKHFSLTYWSKIFSKVSEIDTKKLIFGSVPHLNIPYSKKDSKITLDLDKIHSVYPATLTKSDYEQSLEFKIDSKNIEVIQIDLDNITFSNTRAEVNTVTLNNSLKLKRG